MIANLKTHTVYPEIITNSDTGDWVGKLIDLKGETKENYKGKVSVKDKTAKEIRAEAATAAYAKFNLTIQKYEV